jgi:hypothetical protein
MMRWIKIEDELPPIGKVCLLYQTYPPETMFNLRADPLVRNFTLIGGLTWNGKFVSYHDQHSAEGLKYISHWMELPEKPKVEE